MKSLPATSLNGYYIEKKTKQELTVPETLKQNGMVEGANRYLVEMARCLFLQAKLPKTKWLRAIATTLYLRNYGGTDKQPKSPIENFTGSLN